MNITTNINHLKDIDIYTDGSLLDLGKSSCKMGIGWFIANNNTQKQQFQASIERFPSSTKAEIIAVLTALLVCPKQSNVNIFLDSLSTINTFTKIFKDYRLTHARRLKLPNCWEWVIIEQIITKLELNIVLHKIKGHSNNKQNDLADKLAKEGRSKPTLNINIQTIIPIGLFYKGYLLDKPICVFWKEYFNAKYFCKFLNLQRNIETKNLTQNNQIDWKYCLNTFNRNIEEKQSTSFTQSNFDAFKTKLMFKELPTIKHLSHKYEDLYSNLNCPTCDREKEDHNHLWKCDNRQQIIEDIKTDLYFEILNQSNKFIKKDAFEIDAIIDAINDIDFVSIINGLILKKLTSLINQRTNQQNTHRIIYNSINKIIHRIYEEIWKPRCIDMIEYEKKHNITKNSKRKPSSFKRNNNNHISINHHSTWNLWISMAINLGGQWTDF